MPFVPNPGFLRELAGSEGVLGALAERVDAAREVAEQTAPRATGHYANSFETVVDEETGTVRLINTDFKASFIEFGTVHQRPDAVIRRAVRAAGLKLKELPKKQ